MNIQTELRDTILKNCSDNVQPDDHAMLDAVEELSLSATERACLNWRQDGHLLDWDEFRGAAL